jgi:hypothetical protein
MAVETLLDGRVEAMEARTDMLKIKESWKLMAAYVKASRCGNMFDTQQLWGTGDTINPPAPTPLVISWPNEGRSINTGGAWACTPDTSAADTHSWVIERIVRPFRVTLTGALLRCRSSATGDYMR